MPEEKNETDQKQYAMMRSPDELDQLVDVTSSYHWLALLGILVFVISVALWSVLGTLPTYVDGDGILVKPTGVSTISSIYSGQLDSLAIKPGDTIQKNQVIGKISQPDLKLELRRLDQRVRRYKKNKDARLLQSTDEQRYLREKIVIYSEIRSPYAGKVLEITADPGGYVKSGTPIANVERDLGQFDRLEAILYLNPSDGKRVKPGMAAKISPSTAPKEKYGFIEGTVKFVAEFPSTFSGLMSVLNNEALVKVLLADGAPLKVVVTLMEDSQTINGYKWSSETGAPIKIDSGTFCRALVKIQDQRPIELVLPTLIKH